MLAKIMFAGDLHKLHKDISTISGYVKCCNAVQRALMKLIEQKGITHFVSLGDWYHKGYSSDIAASLADVDLDIQMHNILNGNFYGVIGNHLRLNMDSNPELHLIQPHDTIVSRRAPTRQYQIIRTPATLTIGTVQISLMHTNDRYESVTDYKPVRNSGTTFHIGVFHTPLIIPSTQLARTGLAYTASPTNKIAETLEGVDFAILGDYHIPLGSWDVSTASGVCKVYCPGSLTNTDAGEHSRHYAINIPIVTIEDDCSVSIEYQHFDLLTHMLKFEAKETANTKLKTTRGKATPLNVSLKDSQVVVSGDVSKMTLTDFINARGYTSAVKDMMYTVLDAPSDINKLVGLFVQKNEEDVL